MGVPSAPRLIASLHDFGVPERIATRSSRERTLTRSESAIRARFVPDSFHSLSTELGTGLSTSHCGTHLPRTMSPVVSAVRDAACLRELLNYRPSRVNVAHRLVTAARLS